MIGFLDRVELLTAGLIVLLVAVVGRWWQEKTNAS